MTDDERLDLHFPYAFAAAVGLALYVCSLYSYLFFHIMVEITSISIGFTLFILTWNARRFLPNDSFKVLGIGYAFIAAIDLLHTIAYKGMNVFAGFGANLPTQLWIAARYLQAFTLCAAPLLARRRFREPWLIAVYLVAVAAIVAAVFSGNFPNCFVEEKGLTPFKIFSEYVITAILLLSLLFFHRIQETFSRQVYTLFVASIVCTAFSEIAFTAYLSVYGPVNMVGHLLKVAAFYLLYRALLVTGFREPLDLIFRDLRQAQESLRKAHDTLEEKVRERTAELRASEEEFRTLAEGLPDMVIRFDGDGCCRYVNPAVSRTFGADRGYFLGKRISQFSAGACRDNDMLEERVCHALATGEPNQVESVLLLPEGKREYEMRHIPERDENGTVVSVLGIARDIAERKRAEEEIHLQALELEQEVAERQKTQESLEEQTVQLQDEIEARRKAQAEVEMMNSGLEQRVKERTAEIFDKNVELQRAYDDLKRIQAQLLQQDKMACVGQLAAGVAHEINNPMGFILSNLSSLGKYAEKVAAYLEVIDRALMGGDPAARQMVAAERQKLKMDYIRKDMPELIGESLDGAMRVRQIVQNLKRFSRSDALEEGDFADINDGLESTLSIAWNELKYKSTVIKEYGVLPRIWCNLGQLNQVFLNILVNAAQAIEERGEIRIRTWEEDGTVRIALSDTGSGIAKEHQKRIFEPFFTTKEVGSGTGLGLAIAYDIVVNKHGGTIDVASEPGKGTTFTIALPAKESGLTVRADAGSVGAA